MSEIETVQIWGEWVRRLRSLGYDFQGNGWKWVAHDVYERPSVGAIIRVLLAEKPWERETDDERV